MSTIDPADVLQDVVPHTGDVDRNTSRDYVTRDRWLSSPIRGTWIEIQRRARAVAAARSSPIRGTWIEIVFSDNTSEIRNIVPHTGDVDRNITYAFTAGTRAGVVPHTGDVDRNIRPAVNAARKPGRPPYGGRG